MEIYYYFRFQMLQESKKKKIFIETTFERNPIYNKSKYLDLMILRQKNLLKMFLELRVFPKALPYRLSAYIDINVIL